MHQNESTVYGSLTSENTLLVSGNAPQQAQEVDDFQDLRVHNVLLKKKRKKSEILFLFVGAIRHDNLSSFNLYPWAI